MPAGSLVERVHELDVLAAMVSQAARGDGGLAVIEGPAGIGKTRLLADVRARSLAAGALTLTARCSELERSFSFGVVRQLFEACILHPDRRETALAGAAASAREVFASPQDAPDPERGPDASFATLHGLYWLALNLAADGPLVLAVDDLQWCDRASLRFVVFLARRLEDQPILVATTLRGADAGTDPALIAEIANDPLAVTVRPGPLSAAASAAIVRDRLDGAAEPALCAACHDATGGNPLLLGQLLSVLETSDLGEGAGIVREIGPRAVAGTVLLRLARLPATALGIARAVAVLGDGAGVPAVAALTGLDDGHVAEVSAALARVEILQPDAPLRFVHALVREAVYRHWQAAERADAHELAARMLDDAGADAEHVAAHMLLMPCRGQAWVIRRLHEAGRVAAGRGTPDGAVTYLRRALDEPPSEQDRPQLLLELGLAEALCNGPAAVAHMQAAYDTLEDGDQRALAAHVLAQGLVFTGAPAQAVAFARHAAAQLPAELGDQRLVLESIELITIYFGIEDPELVERLERHRTRAVVPGPGSRMLAAVTAFEWALTGGSEQQCVAVALAALDGDELLAVDTGFLSVAAINVLSLADREDAIVQWDRLLDDAHRSGSLFTVLSAELWKGYMMLRRGELLEAEQLVRTAGDRLSEWGAADLIAQLYVETFLSSTLLQRGDLDGARAAVGPITAEAGLNPLRLRCEVELLLAGGEAERALALSQEYGARAARVVNPAWAPWRSLQALALDRLDRTAEAVALAEDELVDARRWGAPGTVGRTLRILGTLLREDGLAVLEEAAAVLDGSTAQLEQARALAALGSARRLDRRPTEARDPLRRALELADRCGADGLAAHVRTELYATGVRPRMSALKGAGALTASERRVAVLAAEGLTNRDIAQRLFVTPKTVEMHLSSAYRKLDVSSRRSLEGALAAG